MNSREDLIHRVIVEEGLGGGPPPTVCLTPIQGRDMMMMVNPTRWQRGISGGAEIQKLQQKQLE